MKLKYKSLIAYISPAIGLTLIGLWAYMAKDPFDIFGYFIFGLSIFLIIFGQYFKYQNYKNESAGLEPNDEFSNRIREKAAAKAFSISIYMWLAVILFVKELDPRAKIIVSLGMLGMVLIFFLHWLYYSKNGIADEN